MTDYISHGSHGYGEHDRAWQMRRAYGMAMMAGRMQAILDRVAMIERVDNGLIVRWREPVETKMPRPSPMRFMPGHFAERDPATGDSWKKEDEDADDRVWLVELRATFCADDAAVVVVLAKARRGVEEIARLRREGAMLIESDDPSMGICP